VPDQTFGFGFSGGTPDPNDPQQLQQFMSQLQQMFTTSTGGGPVNWDLARQVAQAHLTGGRAPGGMFGFGLPNLMGMAAPGTMDMAAPGPPEITGASEAEKPVGDPPVDAADKAAVVEALRLADLWLEPESALPSGLTVLTAWTRGEWLAATLDVWRKLCDPVAGRIVASMSELVPEEMPRLWEEDRHGAIVRRFRELGYLYVTLDLQGFRSGSMNEVRKSRQQEIALIM